MKVKNLPDFYLESHKQALYKQILEKQFARGGEQMNIKNKFAFGFVAILAISFVSFGVSRNTPYAQAQEVLSQVEDHIESLSLEERQQLQADFKADLANSLSEAKNASDLRIMSDTEVEKLVSRKGVSVSYDAIPGMDFTQEIQMEAKDSATNAEVLETPLTEQEPEFYGKGLKILAYTNTDGATVFMGVNDQDEPVMKITMMTQEQMPTE